MEQESSTLKATVKRLQTGYPHYRHR
jgi:hypothetical protein